MRKNENLLGDPDFLALEIDRLVNSANNRVQQQRIHIAELHRHGLERARAQRQLKSMQAAFEKLKAYKKLWVSGRLGSDGLSRAARASKPR